jgi:NADH-quinone oxidoreductase subunit M
MGNHLLSWVLFTPLIGAAVLLLIPASQKNLIRIWANIAALAGFAISLPLAFLFNKNADGFQFVERADWIPALGVHYAIGIDGISLLLVMLTVVIGPIAILSSWRAIETRPKEYYAMFLLQQTGMIGVFVSLDFFLFFVFWEAVLVPMYFIIGVWGGPRKLYAAIKFFLYTLAGGALMLLGILTLYFQHFRQFHFYTFEISELMKLSLPLHLEQWVFWAFFIGFAIKVPMFPFHTWLPDAHVEAPTAGSVVLASVLLKMGTYGFIRFSLPLLPKASIDATIVQILAVLSIIGILYGALVSLMQQDWKKLVAYSSVSHLGFCTLGIFALNPNGLAGSVIQQINHGISTGMLFLVVGIMYERRHTRELKEYGGLGQVMPVYATVFAFAMLSSAGLPLLNGFIGEFTILQGTFVESKAWAAWAVPGIVLGAAYLLWLYQRVFFGKVTNEKNDKLADLTPREVVYFMPLLIMAFWIGLYPKPFFQILDQPVNQLVQTVRPELFPQNKPQLAAKPPEVPNNPTLAEPAKVGQPVPTTKPAAAMQATPVAMNTAAGR